VVPKSFSYGKKKYLPWCIIESVCQPTKLKQPREVQVMKLGTDSLAHTQWNCKYHIVFAPKYRRQVIYGKIKVDTGKMLRKLCEYKGMEIIEAEACKNHIHMLVSIPPKYSVSQIMGYLKGKSSLMIFEKYANLKYKYGNRHFWCRGFYVDTVGRNRKAIEQYIKNQLKEDHEEDQLSIKEFVDPFTGLPVKEG
jgi:putative transposase